MSTEVHSARGCSARTECEQPLFPNYRNFLYPVPNGGGRFLLFNPAIHYWLSVNESGADIVRFFQEPATIGDLRRAFQERSGMTSTEFDEAVAPFIDMLVSDRFLSMEAASAAAAWELPRPELDTPEDYPWEDIIVSLGDRCNLACPYCFNQNERRERLEHKELRRIARADIVRVLAEFKAMGGTGVIFTGGEPTLNPEFLDICEDATALGFSVKVITNGTQLKRLDAVRLVEAVAVLAVSLDSGEDSVNAILWGTKKYRVHDHILTPLGEIGRRRRRDGQQIRITIKPTIARHNLHGLPELARHVGRALSDCIVGFDITGYQEIGSCDTDRELSVSREELEAALTEFARSGGYSGPDAEIFGLSQAGKFDGVERPRALSCAPSFFVTNTGDIYPCQMLENSEFLLGNVFDVPLRQAFSWRSFVELRSRMTRDDIEICRECEFRHVCVEHCHGCAHKASGRTTAFMHPSELACRTRMIRRLWLETQRQPRGAVGA